MINVDLDYWKINSAANKLIPWFQGTFVYLIKSQTKYYKIGRTGGITGRLKELEKIFKNKYGKLEYVHLIPCDEYVLAEDILYIHYRRKHIGREWFELSSDDVKDIKSILCFRNYKFVIQIKAGN